MTTSKKILIKTFWTSIILSSAYYLNRGILLRFFREGIRSTFWNKQFLYILHLATAIAPLISGLLQFWNWIRKRSIKLPRTPGKIYIVGSLLGGISAFILGIAIFNEGSVAPLVVHSLLWLFKIISAWMSIRNKKIKAHRLFMIRSYTLAFTFIFRRILGDLLYKKNLFFFIKKKM